MSDIFHETSDCCFCTDQAMPISHSWSRCLKYFRLNNHAFQMLVLDQHLSFSFPFLKLTFIHLANSGHWIRLLGWRDSPSLINCMHILAAFVALSHNLIRTGYYCLLSNLRCMDFFFWDILLFNMKQTTKKVLPTKMCYDIG